MNNTNPPQSRRGDHVAPSEIGTLRGATFVAPRRRWPGVMAASVLGAAIAAVAVSSFYDERSIGQRIDAGVDVAGQKLQTGVEGLKEGAGAVTDGTAATGGTLAASLEDAGITASVKTALAADPGLSAMQIDVDTRDGVVTLSGPAPDDEARERAAMIAAAPDGVRSVDNRLVVPLQSARR